MFCLQYFALVCATNPQHWVQTVLLAQSFASGSLKRFSAFDHTLLLWARYELVTHLGVRGLVGAFNAIPPSWNPQSAYMQGFFFFRHWFWNLETRSVSTPATTVALNDLLCSFGKKEKHVSPHGPLLNGWGLSGENNLQLLNKTSTFSPEIIIILKERKPSAPIMPPNGIEWSVMTMRMW